MISRLTRVVAFWALLGGMAFAIQGGTNITFQDGTIALSGQVAVSNGGTGLGTLTDGSVLLGAGTGNVEFATPGNAGAPLISAGAGVNPTFTNLDLADTDAVGATILGVANGGTGLSTSTEDAVMVGNSTTAWEKKVIPDCDDTGGNHINYDQGTNAFTCGTSSSGSGVNSVVIANTMGSITQGSTLHMSTGQVDASQSRAQAIAATTSVFNNMRCVSSVAPGGSDSFTITLADGACTGALSDSVNQTVTISASARTAGPAGTSESITAGECWAVKVVASATAASAVISCTFDRTP